MIIAVIIWYRNEKYDRVLSLLIFTIGLIQLIEYGIHSGANKQQAAKSLFVTLWLQCLLLGIAMYVYLKQMANEVITNIALVNMIVFGIVFVTAIMYVFLSKDDFSVNIQKEGQIQWSRNGGSLLGNYGWLYLIGIFLPLILLLWAYNWKDIGLYVMIIYLVCSLIFVVYNYQNNTFGSMWCYLAVGFAFIVWLSGMFPREKNSFS